MRAIILIIILLSFSAYGQENPWEKKPTKNPWETTEKAKVDTITVEKHNSDTIKVEKPKIDTIKTAEKLDSVPKINSKVDLTDATDDAKAQYKAGGDFAFGFASGFIFNLPGTIISLIYVVPNSKREKAVVDAITTDSTYAALDDAELKKGTRKKVKEKKTAHTLGGVLVGSVTQIAAIMGLVALSF